MSIDQAAATRISARIERLPVSPWHWRALSICGVADFMDAFDSLTLAFVMPVLARLWKIGPSDIGLLISAGFIGQAIGAVVLSYAAERYGRVKLLAWTLLAIAIFSLLCAWAWDFQSLFWLRTLQGLAIGAEVPIAATYMNEVVMARRRGTFTLGIQTIFGFGVLISSFIAAQLAPRLGWQSLFIIGASPALLALPLPWLLPESPRWLASVGRGEEAEASMRRIEAIASGGGKRLLSEPNLDVPPPQGTEHGFMRLFDGIYARRTLGCWILMFTNAYVAYSLLTWIPSIFSTVYKLPVEESLNNTFLVGVFGFCGTLTALAIVDRIPRKLYFLIAFVGSGASLLTLGVIGVGVPTWLLVTLLSLARAFAALSQTGIFVYVPEVYPTRIRALGVGVASAWQRVASVIGPIVIGYVLATFSVSAVYFMFAIVAAIGAANVALLLIEGRGKILEELSP